MGRNRRTMDRMERSPRRNYQVEPRGQPLRFRDASWIMNAPTQVAHPTRSTVRTASVITVASVVVVLLFALAGALQDMGQTSGIAGTIIAVSTLLQRIIVYPPIAAWIALHVPWLAPTPPSET